LYYLLVFLIDEGLNTSNVKNVLRRSETGVNHFKPKISRGIINLIAIYISVNIFADNLALVEINFKISVVIPFF